MLEKKLILFRKIVALSKRGILDDGTYLTEIGSELLKKIKIKPPPAPKRNRNKATISNTNTSVDGDLESQK